ncbi:hypothetical protein ABH926_009965 [Catenulispora sp. GP43]|uniref:hypothetical protein n=1 Tax=Catenulispora sp. GP43 TaxID=3156263 RepID=UPI0035174745
MPQVEGPAPVESAIPDGMGPVADMAGIMVGDVPAWLVLGEDGVLSRWAPGRSVFQRLTAIPPAESGSDKIRRRLHASLCGRFAAVVDDYGTTGTVIDLSTGRTTMTLDGGDYCEHVVPFALAFAEHDGSPVLIHRTRWNRLDVSDPATGRLLTERETPERRNHEDEPPHYLDYFHGALYLSPDGNQICDDGWIWQPFGMPTVWSLTAWLDDNVWESEDGPSRAEYPFLEEWDRGIAWVTSNRIAVQDVGDREHPPCIRVLDPTAAGPSPYVTSMAMLTVTTFPGPGGRYFSDGNLLLVSGETELEAWNIEQGIKTYTVPRFTPIRQHPHSLELVEINTDAMRRWVPPGRTR